MGKVSQRVRIAFAISSVIFLAVLAVSPIKDTFREWRRYKRDYVRFAQTRVDSKRLLADYQPNIEQIWVPQLGVVDRCVTCHQGLTQASLLDAAVPKVFRAHPPIPHRGSQWGCVVCHRGQGRATEVTEAHETTLAWERPMLPIRYIQASCGSCHQNQLQETPQLNYGRQALVRLNCVGCHRMGGVSRPEMLGPDLTSVGNKVTREWIYKWLKDPRTITDSDGNVKVNGVETAGDMRMPRFRLTEPELRVLSAYVSSLQGQAIDSGVIDPRVVAVWEKKPDVVEQGELRFRQMFCTTCHSLAVTRGGETKLIGGDIGPELTKVATKVKPEWLVAWLRNPQGYLPHSQMPQYRWTDEDLYKVTRYIQAKLSDSSLLSDVPKLGAPAAEEVEQGKRLFVQKGCPSCHVIKGLPSQNDFGPDLSNLGGKTTSQLEFGRTAIPRTLVAYIRAKITDPLAVNPSARMPQYQIEPARMEELTTALLSMTGGPSTSAMGKLQVPATRASFHPAGAFGALYERYKCYVCHSFNGYGGTLAPDLSFEGSRARRAWLMAFMKNPQTLRPTLTMRMPQFNLNDQETATIADYFEIGLASPAVMPAAEDPKKFTPQLAAVGKQLYEVRYECQSCHTIGSAGGYVGPNLSNVGNWMKAEWIEAWLRNPQSLVPGAIEPRRSFTNDEIQALTAYLLSLRQTGGSPKPARANLKLSSDTAAAGGSR